MEIRYNHGFLGQDPVARYNIIQSRGVVDVSTDFLIECNPDVKLSRRDVTEAPKYHQHFSIGWGKLLSFHVTCFEDLIMF